MPVMHLPRYWNGWGQRRQLSPSGDDLDVGGAIGGAPGRHVGVPPTLEGLITEHLGFDRVEHGLSVPATRLNLPAPVLKLLLSRSGSSGVGGRDRESFLGRSRSRRLLNRRLGLQGQLMRALGHSIYRSRFGEGVDEVDITLG